jgi:integrase
LEVGTVSARTLRTPSYRLHKPTGQAVVTLDGRDFYLGRFGSSESRAEYDRIIVEWISNGRRLPAPASGVGSDLTVNELLLAYLGFADSYYVKHGRPTTEPASIRLSIRPLRPLYGDTMAKDFGPLQLKAIRQAMIGSGLCRNEVNKRTGRIVRLFKWAVGEGMVPPSVHHGLQAVSGLRRGRADVRESGPVKPVPEAFVDAIRPHVSRQVWAMIQLQRLSGMRPQEVCLIRSCDLDTSGRVWIYTPREHKTEHHGRERKIYLGPQAQAVLREWLHPDLTAPLFQPREAMEERQAERRRGRKTPLTPSQRGRKRQAKPKRSPGERYETRSYYHAVLYGIRKANQEAEKSGNPPIPAWHPNQLRHNAATRLRKEFGLDVARAVLGHSTPVVTEVYAELDGAKAAEAMERVG